jgi:hypothetical protein
MRKNITQDEMCDAIAKPAAAPAAPAVAQVKVVTTTVQNNIVTVEFDGTPKYNITATHVAESANKEHLIAKWDGQNNNLWFKKSPTSAIVFEMDPPPAGGVNAVTIDDTGVVTPTPVNEKLHCDLTKQACGATAVA